MQKLKWSWQYTLRIVGLETKKILEELEKNCILKFNKVNKALEYINYINKENSSNEPIIKEKSKEKDPTSIKKQSYRRSYSSTDSSDDRYRTRKLNKENKSESTRKEKMDLLLKLTTLINNNHGKYSSKMSKDAFGWFSLF